MQINATITQTTDNSIILLADMLSLRGLFFIVLRAMFIIFGLKSIIKQLLDLVFRFFPLEMYNKTIIGFGFCGMQDYQCLGKNYHLAFGLAALLLLPRH